MNSPSIPNIIAAASVADAAAAFFVDVAASAFTSGEGIRPGRLRPGRRYASAAGTVAMAKYTRRIICSKYPTLLALASG
jgi:hypothetical protein